jgi:hypothetical protein
MTTDARLRAAKRAILQAATLLREAASLGTMAEGTRYSAMWLARDLRDVYAHNVSEVRAQCNRDLDAVRKAKRKRGAA